MSDAEYVYAWRYEVAPERRHAFERLYGPDGAWVQLFSRSADWLSTELLADLDRPGVYVTIDRWRSRSAYDEFRASVGAEWAEIDQQGEQLTLNEEEVARLEPVGMSRGTPTEDQR
jgi:quinol monooxygenase YgiN